MKKFILLLVLLIPNNCFASEQVISGNAANELNSTTTEYMGIFATRGDIWTSTEIDNSTLVSSPGVFKDFLMQLNASPGAGNSYTFTLYKNGSPTALTCTISESDIECQDTTNEITLAQGDLISIESVPTSSPSARDARWSFIFEPTVAGESFYGGHPGGNAIGAGQTRYIQTFSHISTSVSTNSSGMVVPTEGVIQDFCISPVIVPGVGNTLTATLRQRTLAGTWSDTSLTCTVSDTETECCDTTNTVSIGASQVGYAFAAKVVSSGAATTHLRAAVSFAATDTDEFFFPMVAGASTSATYYEGFGANQSWTSEANVNSITNYSNIKNMFVAVNNDPSPGNYVFTLRSDGADTAMSLTMSAGETYDSITNSFVEGKFSLHNLKSVPASSPTGVTLMASFTAERPPELEIGRKYSVDTTDVGSISAEISDSDSAWLCYIDGDDHDCRVGDIDTDLLTIALGTESNINSNVIVEANGAKTNADIAYADTDNIHNYFIKDGAGDDLAQRDTTTSGTTISTGGLNEPVANIDGWYLSAVGTDADDSVVCYQDSSGSDTWCVASARTGSWANGSAVEFGSSQAYQDLDTAKVDTDKFIVIGEETSTGDIDAQSGTLITTAITMGSNYELTTTASSYPFVCSTAENGGTADQVIAGFSNGSGLQAEAAVFIGTAINFTGTETVIDSAASTTWGTCTMLKNDKVLFAWQDETNSEGNMRLCDVDWDTQAITCSDDEFLFSGSNVGSAPYNVTGRALITFEGYGTTSPTALLGYIDETNDDEFVAVLIDFTIAATTTRRIWVRRR